MAQAIPSALRPAWTFIVRDRSSTRNTPANASPNRTTAELKMLLERGSRSRGMIGFRLERQTSPAEPGGRSSQGIGVGVGEALPGTSAAVCSWLMGCPP